MPFDEFVAGHPFAADIQAKFPWHDDAALIAETGKSFSELSSDENHRLWSDEARALLLESANS